ncbi:hypothetical protein VSH64_24940 [Amycolatopsis rhabdoformis]|uniref:Uncharacterized protein n=1 Tax=Amycolatopsis rhabdoformis TaxID=1448059 RepID=A0ABZ1HXM9_9PSEU|nr:hypothetical protein [Amycolatopsis rhabdoformis]WSE26125.1 hypothetical protein VSH64_24940 [Amycolatopsis rhabdoformis]
MTNYEQWVRDGQRVEARYVHGDGVHATGYVYAYSDRPTVVLVQEDGREVYWGADLCVPVDGGSNEARNAALARRSDTPMDLATARRIVAEAECRAHGHDWDAIMVPMLSPLPGAFICSRCRAKLTVTASGG